MGTTVTGVQELHGRIVDLVAELEVFRSHAGDHPLPPHMLDRMKKRET